MEVYCLPLKKDLNLNNYETRKQYVLLPYDIQHHILEFMTAFGAEFTTRNWCSTFRAEFR